MARPTWRVRCSPASRCAPIWSCWTCTCPTSSRPPATRLHPGPLPGLPGLSGLAALQGLELARQLRGLYPRLRILVLSGRTETEVVRAALRAGADGFIAKDFVRHELLQALEAVLSGRRWLSPSIATALQAADQATAGLTPRQRDVLAHIARGQSNKQIARSLGISVKTVEYHRGELIARLDLHDVASLTRYALSQGLAG